MSTYVIFDLDGTLCDITHRLHHIVDEPKNWGAFFAACVDDEPKPKMIEFLNTMRYADHYVYIFSGRSDAVRAETEAWLEKHQVSYHELIMRQDGDYRVDHVVKEEMFDRIFNDETKRYLSFAVDDRNQVVEMWRRKGITCLQCEPGDF